MTATNTSDYAQGILLQSADSSPATLTVNGGELTASGQRAGIKYVFGSSGDGDGTPGLTVSDNAVVLADVIVQKVLAPLLTPVISVVLFFVVFALLRMLVSMLVTVLGLVNRLPVIGTVNRWLGWLTGCIASTMDIYLVLCVVWAIIVITGGNLTVLNDTVMSSSLYYKAFNLFNPFL